MSSIRKILAFLIVILGFICAGYVGGWLMFIHPIIEACKAFDTGTLTGLMVGVTVLKCIFASTVAGIIIWISSVIAGILGM